MFVGGIGLATKIIVEEIPDPRIDPYSPENILIFMTGALTGTPVYGASRYVVAAKSPLTGAWGEAHVAGLYTYATGIKRTVPELMKIAKRIFTLKRLFNIACGITRVDVMLPRRFLKEPLNEGGAKGEVVELEPMLKEYYEFMGWNDNGVPKREVLEELGLLKYVEKLRIKI